MGFLGTVAEVLTPVPLLLGTAGAVAIARVFSAGGTPLGPDMCRGEGNCSRINTPKCFVSHGRSKRNGSVLRGEATWNPSTYSHFAHPVIMVSWDG